MSMLKESCLAVCLVLLAMANAETNNRAAISSVADGINKFSSSLFASVATRKQGNFMMSPLSQSVVLAELAYGAGGKTRQQFQQVLGLPASDVEGQAGYQALIDYLNSGKEFNIGNQLFVKAGLSVKPDYETLVKSSFYSGVQYVNFGEPAQTADLINEWIQHVTPGHHGHLKDVVVPGDLDQSSQLVLVDAVYFFGPWQEPFNPSLTTDLPFNLDENTQTKVATMRKQGVYAYGEFAAGDATFLVLPLEGGETSLIVLLPNKVNGLAHLEEQLKNVNIPDLLNKGIPHLTNVNLPKLHFRTSVNLNRDLYALGLTDVFSSHANLSHVSSEQLALNKVLQTTFLTIDEDGIDADSGSAGVANQAYTVEDGIVEFNVDHPFSYAVVKKINAEGNGPAPVVTIYTGHIVEPQV